MTIILIFVVGIFIGCDTSDILLSASVPTIDKTREAKVLIAFFGLDNDLPGQSVGLYRKAPGKDGMPIVFSQEINPETLNVADFEITSLNGSKFGVEYIP